MNWSTDELQALKGFLDAGLRQLGLQAAKTAAVLADKIDAALLANQQAAQVASKNAEANAAQAQV
jgi:hypothetical protein